jgi:hypothetical protein
MSRSLLGLRALTLTASLLAGSTAALGQGQKSTEEDHGQHQQQPGNDPQDHSQHDMSNMAGMDHSAMGHSGMNSSGMFLMNESSGTGFLMDSITARKGFQGRGVYSASRAGGAPSLGPGPMNFANEAITEFVRIINPGH